MKQINSLYVVFILMAVASCSSNDKEQVVEELINDSIINVQLRTMVDSMLSQYIQLKLDSFCASSSYRNDDTIKSISGKGFSSLYREIFDVTGSCKVSHYVPSCISLKVIHRHIGNVFEMHGTNITNYMDSLTFFKRFNEYEEHHNELMKDRANLVENAYANQTKVHFGISRGEYNRLGEDFQRNFYEGLVGYGAYELAKPIFDWEGNFTGFEISETREETFSYFNVQNNAKMVEKRRHLYGADETFFWDYVCELYNMEIMSRYDKFDRRTKSSLKCYWTRRTKFQKIR